MRADPELGGATLVALTGYAGPEDIRKAKEAGFDDHLAKPATIESLQRVGLASLEATPSQMLRSSARPSGGARAT